jgi:NAD(P)-dependent dehydrogenase (short-subunit alcohol dehydrogenase family)
LKTALVTGAGRGIGLATAKALSAAGLRVIALDREFPQKSSGVTYDLENLKGIAALVESLGAIDILVNNAGVQTAVSIERYTPTSGTA